MHIFLPLLSSCLAYSPPLLHICAVLGLTAVCCRVGVVGGRVMGRTEGSLPKGPISSISAILRAR
jgi:hypothetical protein